MQLAKFSARIPLDFPDFPCFPLVSANSQTAKDLNFNTYILTIIRIRGDAEIENAAPLSFFFRNGGASA